MPNLRKGHIKHAKLVDKCYPKDSGYAPTNSVIVDPSISISNGLSSRLSNQSQLSFVSDHDNPSSNDLTTLEAPPVPPLPNPSHTSLTRERTNSSSVSKASSARTFRAVTDVPDDWKPNEQQLSYLTYYAASKPKKLTKVGAFLEKRLQKDMKKNKKGAIAVTLDIFRHLLRQCGDNVHIFLPQLIQCLYTVVVSYSGMQENTKTKHAERKALDLGLVRRAAIVLHTLTQLDQIDTKTFDYELQRSYITLLNAFAKLLTLSTSPSHVNTTVRQKAHLTLSGLLVAHGVVTSPEVQRGVDEEGVDGPSIMLRRGILDLVSKGLDGKSCIRYRGWSEYQMRSQQVPTLDGQQVPQGLSPGMQQLLAILKGELQSDPTDPITFDLENEMVVEEMALGVVGGLFTNLRDEMSVLRYWNAVLKHFEYDSQWTSSALGPALAQEALTSLQSNLRFLLPISIMQTLTAINNHPTSHVPVPKEPVISFTREAILVDILSIMLMSPYELRGINIIEMQKCLVMELKRVCFECADKPRADATRDSLVGALGGLASHLYYADQISDLVTSLLQVISDLSGENVPVLQGSELMYQHRLLRGLNQIVHAGRRASQSFGWQVDKAEMRAWMNGLKLLSCEERETRLLFARALCLYMIYDDMDEATDKITQRFTRMSVPWLSLFEEENAIIDHARRGVLQYASVYNLTPADMYCILTLIRSFVVRFGKEEFVRLIPLVFEIQKVLDEEPQYEAEKEEQFWRRVGYNECLLLWLSYAGTVFLADSFLDYVKGLKDNSMSLFESTSLRTMTNLPPDFTHLYNEHSRDVDNWVERSKVVDLISNCQAFTDDESFQFVRVDRILWADFGRKSGERPKQGFRIRPASEDQQMPTAAIDPNPSLQEATPAKNDTDASEPVKVQSLKRALTNQSNPPRTLSLSSLPPAIPVQNFPSSNLGDDLVKPDDVSGKESVVGFDKSAEDLLSQLQQLAVGLTADIKRGSLVKGPYGNL